MLGGQEPWLTVELLQPLIWQNISIKTANRNASWNVPQPLFKSDFLDFYRETSVSSIRVLGLGSSSVEP